MSTPADPDRAAELEATAAAIAHSGRELLLERLRVAYREAAAAHADVLQLDDERIETMVQKATQRADGLQWRRALASAGAQELQITIAQSLTHPAVERAQAIAGAPSYEPDSAAPSELAPAREEPNAPLTSAPRFGRLDPEPGPAIAAAGLERGRARDGAGVVPEDTEVHDLVPVLDEEPLDAGASFPDDGPDPIRVRAVHLGGVADLTADQKIDLRISSDGLDLIDADDTIMGRLGWSDIEDLFVPDPVGRRERRRPAARLVVQTRQGDASFEVATLSREVLRERLRPLVAYFRD